MASVYRTYKISYNTVEETILVHLEDVKRKVSESTVVSITPSGAKWKQVFGNGKISWVFSFDYTERNLLNFFQNAYDAAASGATLTFSEETDSGTFNDYSVIINLPRYTPDTLGADATDRGLSAEVLEA